MVKRNVEFASRQRIKPRGDNCHVHCLCMIRCTFFIVVNISLRYKRNTVSIIAEKVSNLILLVTWFVVNLILNMVYT